MTQLSLSYFAHIASHIVGHAIIISRILELSGREHGRGHRATGWVQQLHYLETTHDFISEREAGLGHRVRGNEGTEIIVQKRQTYNG